MKDRGFILPLILVVIALAAAYYFFEWSIFDAAGSERGQRTIQYIKDVLATAWAYVREYALLAWNKVVGYLPSR